MIHSIFSPFYYKNRVCQHDRIKSILIDHIKEEHSKDPNNQPSSWSCRVHTSQSKYDEKISKIRDLYEQDIILFFDEIKMIPNVEVDISDIWFNAYGKGQWQESHHHYGQQNVYFSAVHFLKYDKTIHPPLVMNNMNRMILTPFDVGRKTGLNYWDLDGYLDVDEGDLIIFPSIMEHQVGVQETDELRATVSFNIEVKPYNEKSSMSFDKIQGVNTFSNSESFGQQYLENFISEIPNIIK